MPSLYPHEVRKIAQGAGAASGFAGFFFPSLRARGLGEEKPVPLYSAIIYKDGDEVRAEDWKGRTIASGKAGVDDASVIQSALDVGGRIIIKDGVYTVVSPPVAVTVNKKCIIEGESLNTILKGIAINVDSPAHIRNLQIDMEGTTWACISVRDFTTDWKLIENCILKGGGGCIHIKGDATEGARYANGKVIIRNNEFWNRNSPAWGCIVYEQATYDIWIIGNKFYETSRPFIEASSEAEPFNPIDDVYVLYNEFIGPQTIGDPTYPQTNLSKKGGHLYVIGNVWRPSELDGLDSYRNPGIQLSGSYVLFANNIMIGCELEWDEGTTPSKETSMMVNVRDARVVEIIGNIFYGSVWIRTNFRAINIEYLKINGNTFFRSKLSSIFLGNNGTNSNWNARHIEVTDNLFVDWNWSNTYFYQCISTQGQTGYSATIDRLIIKSNRFLRVDGSLGNVGKTVFGNNAYPPHDINIATLIMEDNLFDCVNPIQSFGSISPTTSRIKNNAGYTTENSGTATFSGDGTTTQFSIAHGLVSEPSKVLVTPMTEDAAGDFYVTKDATNIYVNYLSAPPSGSNNVKLSWYAEV